jgi:hypothetical protein
VSRHAAESPDAPRRTFLGQLAAGAAALAGAAYARPAAALPASAPVETAGGEDDAWVARLTGKHKAVFDAPEIADGVVIANTWVFLMSYAKAHKLTDADLNTVAVIRHAAIPMAFDDAMWDKYELGKHAKVKDPATKKWARRNPFWRAAAGDAAGAPYTLEALQARGTILLGCALAAGRVARTVAERTKQKPDVVQAEMRAHLLPGLVLQPSGIYAVTRAQEAGCSFVRST